MVSFHLFNTIPTNCYLKVTNRKDGCMHTAENTVIY